MAVTRFFLGNPRFSLVILLFLLALGAEALRTIPVSEDPALEIPRYDVLALAPGMTPADVEKLVVGPIEDAMMEMDRVKHVMALIHDGAAQLAVEFEFGCDTEKKYDDVLRETNRLRPQLPAAVLRLEVLRGRTENVAVMQIALVAPGGVGAREEDVAEELRRRIERVGGVMRAELHAFTEREVQITLDPAGVKMHHLALPRIVSAIESAGTVIPGGNVEVDGRRMIVNSGKEAHTLESLANVFLAPKSDGSGVVRLGDVAAVEWGREERTRLGRFNGNPALFLTVMMRRGCNILSVSSDIRQTLDSFQAELPPGLRLESGFDQSLNVSARLSHLGRDCTIALLLVLVTLAPLGFRSSVIVMISVPLCLSLGIAALQCCGFGLNQLSIVGCIIALGLLVDDSIVVMENIARFRRDGHAPLEAAELATRQIFAAVLGTTAVLLLAFLPLLMLPEAAGLFIRSLPAAVVFAVLASLFVALTIVPSLASLLLSGREKPKGNRVLRGFQRVITGLYRPILRWCMKRRKLTLAFAGMLCAGSFALIPSIGLSLFPKADVPLFLVDVDAGENARVEDTDAVARSVEQILRREPEVKSVFTTVGQGNPRVYYNVFQSARRANVAGILVGLKAYDNRRTPELIARLRQGFAEIPGARIEIKEFQNGPPAAAPVEVRVVGQDRKAASVLAGEVEALMRATPGLRMVHNPAKVERAEVTAKLDDDKIASLGLNRSDAQQLVRLVFSGLETGEIRDSFGREHTIRLRLSSGGRATLGDWSAAPILVAAEKEFSLQDIAALEILSAPAVIERRGREPVITVSAQVEEGLSIERVTRDLRQRLSAVP
ncbi:MAG TPA: efflux RND transporter permease subunit, partial [Verrucomicrobiaceae bacterium]